MDQVIAAVVGASVTVVLGFGVAPILKRGVVEPQRPSLVTEDQWAAMVQRSGSGDWIGFFERLLVFGAFSLGHHGIIAAWLAFKLAAKWEAWKNIVQVPTAIDGVPPLTWYQVRQMFGSWLLTRFLLGTLLNILVGGIGGAFTLQCQKLFV